MAEGRGSLKDYGLHRAAFHGDVKRIKEILEALKDVQQGEEESVVNFTDDHGELLRARTFYTGSLTCWRFV